MILSQDTSIEIDSLVLKDIVGIEQIAPKQFELIKFLNKEDAEIKNNCIYNLTLNKDSVCISNLIQIKYIIPQPMIDDVIRLTIGFVPWLNI